MTDNSTPQPEAAQPHAATDDEREPAEMLVQLKAAGLSLADVRKLIGHSAGATTLRAYCGRAQASTRGPSSQRGHLGPYLQMLCDGLPELCPCLCPACAAEPCPCGSAAQHADTCEPPQDLAYSCANRYAGVGGKDVADVSGDDVRPWPGGPGGEGCSALCGATSPAPSSASRRCCLTGAALSSPPSRAAAGCWAASTPRITVTGSDADGGQP